MSDITPPLSTDPHKTDTASSPTTEVDSGAYDTLCGICFTNVHPVDNPRGRLNSCGHLFCSYCIKEWAKQTNVCPTCKARFTRIYTQAHGQSTEEETKVRRRNYHAWMDASSESEWEGEEGEDEDEAQARLELLDDSSDDEIAMLLDHEQPRRRSGTVENNNEDTRARRRGRDSGVAIASTELVQCAVCGKGSNAARMMFCDNRQCTYAAHAECLGFTEFPLTFLCVACTTEREVAVTATEGTEGGFTTGTQKVQATFAPAPKSGAKQPSPLPPARASQRKTPPPPQPPAPALPAKIPLKRAPQDWFVRLSEGSLRLDEEDEVEANRAALSVLCSSSAHHPLPPQSATPPATASQRRQQQQQQAAHLPSRRSENASQTPRSVQSATFRANPASDSSVSDDLYFLAPSTHATAAMVELQRYKETHQHAARLRQEKQAAKNRRLEAAQLEAAMRTAAGGPYSLSSPFLASAACGRLKRPRTSNSPFSTTSSTSVMEEMEMELALQEKDLCDPVHRREMEDHLARQWAASMLPVLRRNRDIQEQRLQLDSDGNIIMTRPPTAAEIAAAESRLREQAMTQARLVVRGRVATQVEGLRARRQQLVQARAQREGAALAKLARLIASRRPAPPRHS